MPAAPPPADEAARLAALHACQVLDTACEDAFDDVAVLAAHIAGCPIALVSLVDSRRQWFKACLGLDVRETPRDVSFCAHAILQADRPLVVDDARHDPRFADNPLVLGPPGIRAYLGVPVLTAEGHALGTLCVADRVPRRFDPAVVRMVGSLARTVATTLELRRTMRQVQELALTDPLTGLPNRRAFVETLSRALARQRRGGGVFTLLYLDLDGFKRVNDTAGHAAGDRVLCAVAEVLRATIRAEDVAGRLGGDEFAVLLVGGDGREGELVAERLRRAVRERMAAEGLAVTASIGAALLAEPVASAEGALSAADRLMYAAKAAGRDRVVWCHAAPAPAAAD